MPCYVFKSKGFMVLLVQCVYYGAEVFVDKVSGIFEEL